MEPSALVLGYGSGVLWFLHYSNWMIFSSGAVFLSMLVPNDAKINTWTCFWVVAQQVIYCALTFVVGTRHWIEEDPYLGRYNISDPLCVNIVDYDLLLGTSMCPGFGPWLLRGVRRLPRLAGVLLSFGGSCSLLFAFLHVRAALSSYTTSFPEWAEMLVFVVIDGIWKVVSFYLTILEAHVYWTSFRSWECVKSYAFRAAMFHLSTRGDQFLLMLAGHAFAWRIWNIVYPHLFTCLQRMKQCILCRATVTGGVDIQDALVLLPMWSVSQAYTDLAFTQFLVCMVIAASPSDTLPALVCCAIGALMDRITVELKLKRRWVQASEKMSTDFMVPLTILQAINIATTVGYLAIHVGDGPGWR